MADWFLHTGLYLFGIVLIPAIGLLLAWRRDWGSKRIWSLVVALVRVLR